MTGTRNEFDTIGQDVWILKVDSFGCLEPRCQLLVGLETIIDGYQSSISNYPNPVQDNFELNIFQENYYPNIFDRNQEILMLDETGRVVLKKELPNMSSIDFSIEIDVSFLNPGFYAIHRLAGNAWLDSVKLIKE
ncbi:MAG: T9SS type A sorting domain-containing protein [Flavobacteriales bacterium]|nr:T9SS type A sorting domain-containing protein [Flavobacteriales bacterium]